MRHSRRVRIFSAAVLAAFVCGSATASLLSDFQARLAQTFWSAHQTEAILRTLPQSTAAVSTPDGLSSYAALLSENIASLNTGATVRLATDEQRRVLAEGLQALASMLHDQTALATNRGLTALVSTLQSLEESCRTTIAQLGAQKH